MSRVFRAWFRYMRWKRQQRRYPEIVTHDAADFQLPDFTEHITSEVPGNQPIEWPLDFDSEGIATPLTAESLEAWRARFGGEK